MAISTKVDFSLENCRPEDGFGPIRNPKSFRACLQQVTFPFTKTFTVIVINCVKCDNVLMSLLVVREIVWDKPV